MLFSPTAMAWGPVSWARSAIVEREWRVVELGFAGGMVVVEEEVVLAGAEGRFEVVEVEVDMFGALASERWRCDT